MHHIPVLLEETLSGLKIQPHGTYVDCTLGGGGHSERIAERLSAEGRLIGIDQDVTALSIAAERLKHFPCRIDLVKRNFRQLAAVLDELNVREVNGVLFDVGVSSFQLDQAERGFSYNRDAPLDMRMDAAQTLSAYDIVNEWETDEMARLLWKYGEETFSRRIAAAITKCRKTKPIETTAELARIVKTAIPAAARRSGPHPARRTFQAIRIAVNDELHALKDGLEAAVNRTARGARICVITFHSLEDRIVKGVFRKASQGCVCPPDFPACVCEHRRLLKLVHRKPIVPDDDEVARNPRARSAKLRIAERLEGKSVEN